MEVALFCIACIWLVAVYITHIERGKPAPPAGVVGEWEQLHPSAWIRSHKDTPLIGTNAWTACVSYSDHEPCMFMCWDRDANRIGGGLGGKEDADRVLRRHGFVLE